MSNGRERSSGEPMPQPSVTAANRRLWGRRRVLAGIGAGSALAALTATQRAAAATPASAPPDDAPPRVRAGDGINIRDFGAVGDGKTDDSAAIQRALDTASARQVDLVVVPPGTFLVETGLVAAPPLRLVGLGGYVSSRLVFSGSLAAGLTIITPSDVAPFPGTFIEVSSIAFQMAGTGTMLQMSGAWSTVRSCLFDFAGEAATGLASTNQPSLLVASCQFLNSSASGAGDGPSGPLKNSAGAGTGIALVDSDNTRIVQNNFYHLQYGVHGQRGPVRTYDAGCVVSDNAMFGFETALLFEDWELVQAVSNILDGCEDSCMTLTDCYHSILADNYCGLKGLGSACLVQTQDPSGLEYLGQIVIEGNYVNHYPGAAGSATFKLNGLSPSTPVNQVSIVSNIVNGYPNYGIQMRNAQNVLVTSNTLESAGAGSVASVYDETPGFNHIYHNIVDGPIQAQGDTVQDNFSLAPVGALQQ